MKRLRALLRNSPAIYRLHHALVMAWWRWRLRLKNVDPTFYMGGASEIARDLKAGPHSYIGPGCNVGPGVSLGAYTMLAGSVAIVGGDHLMDVPGVPMCFTRRPAPPSTILGDDVWIGHGAIIRAGLTIGRGAVVGAGAVLTKDVPPYEVWAGVPARRIGERFTDPAERAKHDAVLDARSAVGTFGDPAHAGGA